MLTRWRGWIVIGLSIAAHRSNPAAFGVMYRGTTASGRSFLIWTRGPIDRHVTGPNLARPRSTKQPTGLDPIFEALRAILEPYRGEFRVTDRRGYYSLVDNSVRGWSIDFAAVVMKRGAVSFYLMAQHYQRDLLKGASAGLMARCLKSGKFFNFKELDEKHIAELAGFVERAFTTWDAPAIAKS